jgi:polyphosphate glucokinase
LALGVDVGGSGIKGAPVDLDRGELTQDRHRIDTPAPSTPEAVSDVIHRVVDHFDGIDAGTPIGVTIPGVVTRGVVRTAANIDKSWIDTDIAALLEDRLQRDVVVVNDADAAGVGELEFGAARGQDGLVVVTTLGTGIGTALLYDGRLVPNSELGHLELDGFDAETRAASSIKTKENLSYPEWAKRLQRYYSHLEGLLWPDLFVVGGGVSRKSEKFLPLLDLRTPIVAAQLRNAAGIIGAGVLAAQAQERHGRHTS